MKRGLAKLLGGISAAGLGVVALQAPVSATEEWVTTSVNGTVVALGAGNAGVTDDYRYAFYAQDLSSSLYCATTQMNWGAGWVNAVHDCANDGVGISQTYTIGSTATFVRICQSVKPDGEAVFNCGAARAVFDDQP